MKKLLILSLLICSALLAACGGSEAGPSAPDTPQNEASASAQTPKKAEEPKATSNLYEANSGVLTKVNSTAEEVIIADDITKIDASAFQNATKLKKVTIGASVNVIGDYAFSGCTALEEVKFKGSEVTEIGKSAFSDCTTIRSITLPEGLTEIKEGTFSGCSSLVVAEFPSTLTTIGEYAFSDCTILKKVEMPAGITSIAGTAYQNCTGLKSVECTAGSAADNAALYPAGVPIVAK